jgi:teichuronic acid biosynthesis glycosyltransferase TuaG
MSKIKKTFENEMVSIIMPNFNGEVFIEEAIKSICSQTYKNWELLIIDDGSTDNSFNIIKKYTDETKSIHLLYNKHSKGQAGARNTGIEFAKGQYIAFLDSDDKWYSSKLSIQINEMTNQNVAMSYTWYDQVLKNNKKLNSICSPELKKTYSHHLKRPAIGHSTGVYDRNIVGTKFMPKVKSSDDFGLWLSILKEIPYAICIQKPLAAYRLTPNSISSNKLKAAKSVWNILYKIEKLNIFYALYCFAHYVFYGISEKGTDILFRK